MLLLNDPSENAADGSRTTRPRVVIAGAGFAGMPAKALKGSDADVMLIDRRNHHIFTRCSIRGRRQCLRPSEIAAPIRQLEAKKPT